MRGDWNLFGVWVYQYGGFLEINAQLKVSAHSCCLAFVHVFQRYDPHCYITGSRTQAFTLAWLYKIGLAATPLCAACNILPDVEHYLLECSEVSTEHKFCFMHASV